MTETATHLTELCVLAEKYGTDKLGFYTPIYDLLLSGRRDRVFKVLEVGIGTPETMKHVPGYKAGASLRMWRDYFPNAVIYGLDDKAIACADADDFYNRVCTFHSDSTYPEILPQLAAGGRFDLIVDDGDHTPETQLQTFRNLSPLLVPDGLYIIEDVEFLSELATRLPEHTQIRHTTPYGIGKAILIRQEALDG